MAKIVKKEIYEGFGGPLAIQTERGLIKALQGDTIITLDDGSRHVIAKELATAEPLGIEPEPEQEAVAVSDEPAAPSKPVIDLD